MVKFPQYTLAQARALHAQQLLAIGCIRQTLTPGHKQEDTPLLTTTNLLAPFTQAFHIAISCLSTNDPPLPRDNIYVPLVTGVPDTMSCHMRKQSLYSIHHANSLTSNAKMALVAIFDGHLVQIWP